MKNERKNCAHVFNLTLIHVQYLLRWDRVGVGRASELYYVVYSCIMCKVYYL